MGCDIHGIVERRWNKDQKWERECEIERNRNYSVFSILAGVREQYGITPIAEPRGLPDDRSVEYREYFGNNAMTVSIDDDFFGEHSFSHVSLKELVEYDWNAVVYCEGIMDRAVYEKWKASGDRFPESWAQGIWSPNQIDATDDNKPEGWTHIRTKWPVTIIELAEPFYHWIKYLEAKWGATDDVRLVFGFDS